MITREKVKALPRQLADAAMENIGRFGDVEQFIKQGGD